MAFAIAFAAAAISLSAMPAHAADGPVPAAETPLANGEPAVRHTVIDDGRTRIEELRVRGQLQRITVEPKGRAPAYEIVTGDGAPDFADGAGGSRGAAGKRVWNVFRF